MRLAESGHLPVTMNVQKLELGTTHLLTIINGYSGKEGLRDAADYMIELLKEFASAEDIKQIEF